VGIYLNGSHKTGESEFQLLLAAGLLRRFETISREDFQEKALKCFEGLLDIRESEDSATKVSSLIERQATDVQKSAEAIIDHLLFNKNNDPYLSLGLPKHAGEVEVNRRWRRLIVLYHPDRYPDNKEYEEKAKKLNEAYAQIRKAKEHVVWYGPINDVFRDSPPKADAVHHARYLRYLPTLILALTIFIALISILLFFKAVKDDRQLHNKNERESSRPAAGVGLQIPALMPHDFPSPRITVSNRLL